MKKIILGLLVLGACGSKDDDELTAVTVTGVVAQECTRAEIVPGYSVYWKYGIEAGLFTGSTCKLIKGSELVGVGTSLNINCSISDIKIDGVSSTVEFTYGSSSFAEISYGTGTSKLIEFTATECVDVEGEYEEYE